MQADDWMLCLFSEEKKSGQLSSYIRNSEGIRCKVVYEEELFIPIHEEMREILVIQYMRWLSVSYDIAPVPFQISLNLLAVLQRRGLERSILVLRMYEYLYAESKTVQETLCLQEKNDVAQTLSNRK